jgi:hypothetical protein
MLRRLVQSVRPWLGSILVETGLRLLGGAAVNRVAASHEDEDDDPDEMPLSPLGFTDEARRMIEEGMAHRSHFRRPSPSGANEPLKGSAAERIAHARQKR